MRPKTTEAVRRGGEQAPWKILVQDCIRKANLDI